MKATLLIDERQIIAENAFVELVVWQVPSPVRGSDHSFKYRLAFVVDDECLIRYDNEAGKGDHRHVGGREVTYTFIDAETLFADFWQDVERNSP